MLTQDVRALRGERARPTDERSDAAAIAVTPEPAKSGHTVTIMNTGTTAAAEVELQLTGGLFMLNSAHERIGDSDGFLHYDDVGTLTPGISRQYTAMAAAQTLEPKTTITSAGDAGVQPLVHEL